MAIIKAVKKTGNLKRVINYLSQESKTNEELTSGKDCSNNSKLAFQEMTNTKEMFNKTDGRQYKHFVQSFDPSDKIVTATKAHEIGKKMAELEHFKGFEVLIFTHTDKDHIHNHIIVNSVSFETGKKYQQSANDLENLKKASDKLCIENNLKTITGEEKGKNELSIYDINEYKIAEKGESWKIQLRNTIDEALQQSKSKNEFIEYMQDMGYKVNWAENRKNITYETQEGFKCRDNKLHGTQYLKTNMEEHFKRELEKLKEKKEKLQKELDKLKNVRNAPKTKGKEFYR